MRRHTFVAVAASTALGVAVCLGGASASASPPSGQPSVKAPVTDAAAHGGRVIVVLKDQFSSLKVKRQGHQRRSATRASQRAIASDITAHGGSNLRSLVSVNAVAATMSAAEVRRLRANPTVARIQRDAPIVAAAPAALPAPTVSPRICPANPNKPLLEPEALTLTRFKSQPARPDDADAIATGKGVRVGLTGINALAGNPNFIRPNGEHVVIDSPTPNADNDDFAGGGDEWYGDASSVAGQGTVTYDFSKELPYSQLPAGCTFKIVGIAPDVSLVDTGFFGQIGDATPKLESEAIAGLDRAAIDDGVSVISESYGYGSIPGQTDFSAITEANDALVAAGITVVESSGDSGVGGTVEVPAYDPLVIDAGATTAYRLDAQAWGYTKWQSNQMAPLSSGGVTPANDVVDLVAPGDGGEASCSPASPTCPQTTLTEAFGGTSQSAPFIAGAAADVIQAYADSHGGTQPTPALVKQLLVGSAHDIDAPADEQGAGLLDVYAAVRAAQQQPGTTTTGSGPAAPSLIPSPTQLDVSGNGGTTSARQVTLYNASSHAATVRGTYRQQTAPQRIGQPVTEQVTAPPASQPVPAEGAQAAPDVTMRVPRGLSQLGVDFRTPNPANDAVLALLLFDPAGRLTEISYDYSGTPTGPVSNDEHVAVNDPAPGRWTARIVWNNGRSHLQDPPPTAGNYRGPVVVRFTGRHAQTSPATAAVTIPARSSRTVPVSVHLPDAPGDHPLSVQFSSSGGALASVPVTRRTLVPAAGGPVSFVLGSSVARESGPLKTLQFQVPAGHKDLRVTLNTADTNPDNVIDYFLVEPNGLDAFYDRTPSTTPQGVGASSQAGRAALVVANPPPGLWTLQAMLDLTTSGKHFEQVVKGTVAYNTSSVDPYSVPDSASTTLAPGASTTLRVGVTNTTRVGRTFQLTSADESVTGNPVYIPAGATVLVTGTLKVTAAAGTVVSGQLIVQSNGSDLSTSLAEQGYFFDAQSVAELPYEYTVASSG